jgi:hypothetical protein
MAVSPSPSIKKPWIETPLIESTSLSKQAGWYISLTHLNPDRSTQKKEQQTNLMPKTAESS